MTPTPTVLDLAQQKAAFRFNAIGKAFQVTFHAVIPGDDAFVTLVWRYAQWVCDDHAGATPCPVDKILPVGRVHTFLCPEARRDRCMRDAVLQRAPSQRER